MNCTRIEISNVGPVTDGEIDLKKIMVFFGPSNTGKSIVSRLIHALRRLDSPPSLLRLFCQDSTKKISRRDLLSLYGEDVLLHAALAREDVVTHGYDAAKLTVHTGPKTPPLELSFEPPNPVHAQCMDRLYNPTRTSKVRSDSVYIPAGRAGMVQSFHDILYLKLSVVEYALYLSLQSVKNALIDPSSTQPVKKENLLPPPGSLPPHIEQFHDLVEKTIMGNPSGQFNRSFSRMLRGKMARPSRGRLERDRVVYADPHGHEVPLRAAGSGLLASAPLLSGLHYVKRGGTLIIEEPEAHIEPSTQLALTGEIVATAMSKNVRLLLTTHSDYVIKKILALVACKKIRASDIGLYYFRRNDESYASIERIPVDPVGAADQEMFREALDSLVEEFSA